MRARNHEVQPTWELGPGVVLLADRRRVRARGLARTSAPEPPPEFGLYLLAEQPPAMDWEQCWLPWRNFWLPRHRGDTVDALRETFDRCATQRVEVACKKGTGRTGTVLACLAILAGTPASDAIAYVRYRYDDSAVRAPWQRWFVRWFGRHGC
jgi:hypothetical protein